MGGTLTQEQKGDFCHDMTILYMFDSPYWHFYLDIFLAVSATIWLATAY